MSIAPASPLTPYPYAIPPLTNITPFTYRDGTTYLEILNEVVGFVQSLTPDIDARLVQIIDQANTAIALAEGNMQTQYDAFVVAINALVAAINNRVGPPSIFRQTLTGPYTLTLDPTWPTAQPVMVQLTQDATGGRVLTLGANITGAVDLAATANAMTEFYLVPVANGTFHVWQPSSTLLNSIPDKGAAGLIGNPLSLTAIALTSLVSSGLGNPANPIGAALDTRTAALLGNIATATGAALDTRTAVLLADGTKATGAALDSRTAVLLADGTKATGAALVTALSNAAKTTLQDISLGLRWWHGRVGQRDNAPADVVLLGDSIAEGYWATAYGRRFCDILLRDLRQILPGPEANVYHATRSGDGAIVTTSGANYDGAGGPGVTLSSGSISNLTSDTGTGFDVEFVGGPTGVGNAYVAVDGAPATTVSTVIPAVGPVVFKVRGLPLGPHSVAVSMATGSPSPVILKSITTYKQGRVRGGSGYHPAYHAAGVFTGQPLAIYGGAAQNAVNGLGYRSAQLVADTHQLQLVDEITGCDILFTLGSGDPFLVKIDGGSFVSVSTSGTAGNTGIYSIRGLAPGMHTITVKGNGGSTGADVHGIMAYNGDENCGIRLWEGAHSGAASANFLTGSAPLKPLTYIQPQCVVIGLGVNDFGTGTGTPIATYKANILSTIAGVRALVTNPPSIVLIAYPEPPSATPTSPWSAYVQQLFDIAAADDAVVVWDLRNRLNPGAPSELGGMYRTDMTHPLDPGHGFIGDSLSRFLAPM